MTKDDWTARVSSRVSASDKVRCPVCDLEQPRRTELAWCSEHERALIDASLLGQGPEPALGRTIAGRYVVLERLGNGATSAVYRARDRERGGDIALKLVTKESPFFAESRQRFACEAEAMKGLQSPHTVRILDSGETEDGSCFLAMELLRGETLGKRLARGALAPAIAIRILEGALKSIVEAHGKGIVHRDLKPENLFLVSDVPGRPDFCKVLDFGIAKLDGSAPWSADTERGTALGTPRYMSPEQAQGAALDARSDLYSLGVVLFQMLTGTPPFVASDPVLVMAKHVRELPPSLTEAAPQLASAPKLVQLVRKLLSKSPEDRPQTAGDLLRQLQTVRRELGLTTHSTTTSNGLSVTSTTTRRRGSNRAWYMSLSAACLAFIAIGWLAKSTSVTSRAGARAMDAGAFRDTGALPDTAVPTLSPARATLPSERPLAAPAQTEASNVETTPSALVASESPAPRPAVSGALTPASAGATKVATKSAPAAVARESLTRRERAGVADGSQPRRDATGKPQPTSEAALDVRY